MKPFDATSIDPSLIQGKTVAVLGYGNQGRAHALNLRDSGVSVRVGANPKGPSWDRAALDGFLPYTLAEAALGAEVWFFSLPDEKCADLYYAELAGLPVEPRTWIFCHGFNIHFGFLKPPTNTDVVLVAAKGPGYGVRLAYEKGEGLPAIVAVHQDASGQGLQLALSYAWAIGSARSVILPTTFKEETECDLFGEQAVLCGGIPALIQMGFETLVAAGYTPEAAYFETVHETKLIVDLIVARGLDGMRKGISDTAEFGGFLAGPRLVSKETRAEMRKLLDEIQDGSFARRWIEEARNGGAVLKQARVESASNPTEAVGGAIRKLL